MKRRTAKQKGMVAAAWATLIFQAATASAVVRAEESGAEIARADELFRAGKEYLARGDHGLACPMFAESYRLDPATGSLLALALCREGEGKLASAHRAYSEVVARARAEGRPDRERAAEDKVRELAPKLSTLTLEFASERERANLVLRVNGEPLEPAQLGHALPLDGGSVRVEAERAGRLPWSSEFTIAAHGEARRLTIPVLESASPPARPALPAAAPRRADAPQHRVSPARVTGLVLIGAGSAGVASGLVFALRGSIRDRQAELNCVEGNCSDEALADRAAADQAKQVATISLVAGATVLAGGLTTLLVSRRRQSARAMTLTPWATASGAGAGLSARY